MIIESLYRYFDERRDEIFADWQFDQERETAFQSQEIPLMLLEEVLNDGR